MVPGDELIVCNGQGKDYHCKIDKITEVCIEVHIESMGDTDTELKTKITLFQGIPKKDKMELIIEKAIELGVYQIIPVVTERTIVRINDKKKEEKKLLRWNKIAESAAKQSRRGIIPKVAPIIPYEEAIKRANIMELSIIPYEKCVGIGKTKEIMNDLKAISSIGIFIGPEGGFEEKEISLAKANKVIPISLGKRILRAETASLTVLSMMMLALED